MGVVKQDSNQEQRSLCGSQVDICVFPKTNCGHRTYMITYMYLMSIDA